MGKRRTGKEADVVLSDGEDGEVHQVAQLRLHLADPTQITCTQLMVEVAVFRIRVVLKRIRIRFSPNGLYDAAKRGLLLIALEVHLHQSAKKREQVIQ
jgi:hypothetical protein